MQASEIMSRPVVTTVPDSLVREAVVKLTEGGFVSLPVVDEQQQVVGMITEGDALRVAEEFGAERRAASLRVADVMEGSVEAVSTDTDVTEVARLMLTDRLRSLPVVEGGMLVGIVSRRDVLRPLVRPDDVVATHVETVLDAYSGQRGSWTVEMSDGIAAVNGEFSDFAEQQVVASLVRTVPGVADVRFT